MSNHVSQYDVLAVVAALEEFQLRWVAKKELTSVRAFLIKGIEKFDRASKK